MPQFLLMLEHLLSFLLSVDSRAQTVVTQEGQRQGVMVVRTQFILQLEMPPQGVGCAHTKGKGWMLEFVTWDMQCLCRVYVAV